MTQPLWFLGSNLATSPSNLLLACAVNNQLRISFANAPERCIDFAIKTSRKDLVAIRWAPDSSRVLLCTKSTIEVVDLEDEASRVHISNGTEGLGRFSAAEFVQSDQVLTVWEFGKAKVWDLRRNEGVEIDDIKTPLEPGRWATRRATANVDAVLAYITRLGAEDFLVIYIPGQPSTMPRIKLPTVDAVSIHWSEDGRWLAVLDTPRQHRNVHILTSDGHLYKSIAANSASSGNTAELGYKSIVWSPTSRELALCGHDNRIDVVHGKTMSHIVTIVHSTTIDEHPQVAKVWQEVVSTTERLYKIMAMPVSPPLSRTKQTFEPRELGVAEASFSCDGTYIASRTESMLSTIWIWNVKSLQAHSIVLQHSNVRRLRWHSKLPQVLLIDCGENIVYLYDIDSGAPPEATAVAGNGNVSFGLLTDKADSISILAATKDAFALLRTSTNHSPSGRDSHMALRDAVDTEDSIFEILSGRAGRPSDTRRLELEADSQDHTAQIEDTFDGRQGRDPLDDSDIF